MPPRAASRWREPLLVVGGFAALAALMTLPVALRLASVGRVENGDGQFAIWNVAWVAHALTTDPVHVFDANIFYPHRWTLAYSDTNLGAGALAVPVYWPTQNAYLAFNFVFLLSFVLSGTGAYCLARRLSGDARAAAVAGVAFAFCPYVLAHTPHIQLLMTAGLPLSLLAFHRLLERPDAPRGGLLGLILAAQTYFCGYYAIFGVLAIGWMVIAYAGLRRWWANRRYWIAIAVAAAVSLAGALPLLLVFSMIRRTTGFERGLAEAATYAATWRSYLTSAAFAHRWLWTLDLARPNVDPLFPGVIVAVAAASAFVMARAHSSRELLWAYGGLGALAAWLSLGPAGGLYSLLYRLVPGFSFMRAPSRVAPLVVLSAAVLGSLAVARLLERVRWPRLVGGALVVATAAELATPVRFREVEPVPPVYRLLATLPRAPLLELPVYSPRFAFARARYMLASTAHWMPLVDAYSDYMPPAFEAAAADLATFPSREALARMERDRVRYAVIHLDAYDAPARSALSARLHEFAPFLARRFADEDALLYEVIAYPD